MTDLTRRPGIVSRLLSAPLAAAGLAAVFTLALWLPTASFAQDLSQAPLAAPSADISFLGLFLQAHFVVKLVMIGLITASIWVWAIIIDKTLLFSRNKREMDRFEQVFWSGQSLEDLYRTLAGRSNQGMAAIFVAAMREWKRTYEGSARSFAGLNQRLDKVMNVTIAREVERLESRLLVLATVGSAGPFMGLFGTVWGVMEAFSAVSVLQTASIQTLAPGVSAALLTTIAGLVVAIPSLFGYNILLGNVRTMITEMENYASNLADRIELEAK